MDRFEINVAKRNPRWTHTLCSHPPYNHYFRVVSTAPLNEVIVIFADLQKRFPESEGFKLTVTQWIERGHLLTEDIEIAAKKLGL